MRRIACISLLLVAAVGCNRATPVEFGQAPSDTRISIAGLKSLCEGVSHRISRDIAIRGYVVANDLYDELYHQIVLQDDSGGISVNIDADELHWEFPIGACVEVRCNGLALHDYGGKIELGTVPDESGNTEIPADRINRFLRLPEGVEESLPSARHLTFTQVDNSQVDTRVRFDQVHLAEAGSGKSWCDYDEVSGLFRSTVREMVDREGNRFPVRTLWCCSYANEALPDGEGSLVGVIDCFGGVFSLRITFHEILFPWRSPLSTACRSCGSCGSCGQCGQCGQCGSSEDQR